MAQTEVTRISDIIETACKIPNREEKVAYLKAHNNVALRNVLMIALEPELEVLLPTGPVKYKPSELNTDNGMLYTQAKNLYIYINGYADNLPQARREKMFVEFLESISVKDADMMVHIKDKKIPFEGAESLDREILKEAFGI